MKRILPLATVIAMTSAGSAWANDDCRRPMAEWQSREAVTARASEWGLATERLRIDDGCYEIRGRDGDGNRLEITVDPATLAILKLEVRLRPGADASRYLAALRSPSAKPGKAAVAPIPAAPTPAPGAATLSTPKP